MKTLSEAEREQRLADWLAARAEEGVNLRCGPLYRFSLLQLGGGEALLVLQFHHGVGDALSWRIIPSELPSAYNAHVAGQAQQPTNTVGLPG